jgi:hypothetical protein
LISIIDLIIFIWLGDLKTTTVFILSGFLTTFFNKNMIVVLSIALVIANVYKFGLKDVRESMKSKKKKRDADLEEFLDDMFEDEDFDSDDEEEEPAPKKKRGKKVVEKMTSDEMVKSTSDKNDENIKLNNILNKLNAVLDVQADSAQPNSAAQAMLAEAQSSLSQIGGTK